jgi:hypothetical protein
MIYNKKLKPTLIDQNIIGEYMKEKMLTQLKVSGVQTQSELQKLSTKIFYNVVNFIYHYFFIIIIFGAIGYYLYNRYLWYQQIKKTQAEQQEEQMKKYFDDIMDGQDSKSQANISTQPIKPIKPINPIKPIKLSQPTHPTMGYVQPQAYFAPGSKLDKVTAGNNGYLNHMKNTFDTTQTHTTSMGRIQPTSEYTTKTVRFAQGDFDAYGRNTLNPKTGETLVKQVPTFNFNQDQNQIHPYDSNNGAYSSF